MTDSTELSLVIPTSHELPNLERLVPNLHETMKRIGCSYEILIVDNNSQDGTGQAAKRLNYEYMLQEGKGYGNALKTGFRKARGKYIITLDADLSHPAGFVEDLWRNRYDADTLIASRYVRRGKAYMPWFRKVLSGFLNMAYSFFLGIGIKDSSSGYRMYRKDILDGLNIESSNFEILQEILIKIFIDGWRIKEIPFVYKPRKEGRSKARVLAFGVAYAKNIIKLAKLRYSVKAADYDARAFNSVIPLQRYWQRKRFRIITGFIGNIKSDILDLGCSSGSFISANPAAVGLDIRMNVLRFNRKQNSMLVRGSINDLPFRPNSFKAIVCSEVIEHVPEDHVKLEFINSLLQKDGILILGTPDYSRWEWVFFEACYKTLFPWGYGKEHINPYTFKKLSGLIEENGFKIEDKKYILKSELILKCKKIKDCR